MAFQKVGSPEQGGVVLDVMPKEDGTPDIRPMQVDDDVGKEDEGEDAAGEGE